MAVLSRNQLDRVVHPERHSMSDVYSVNGGGSGEAEAHTASASPRRGSRSRYQLKFQPAPPFKSAGGCIYRLDAARLDGRKSAAV